MTATRQQDLSVAQQKAVAAQELEANKRTPTMDSIEAYKKQTKEQAKAEEKAAADAQKAEEQKLKRLAKEREEVQEYYEVLNIFAGACGNAPKSRHTKEQATFFKAVKTAATKYQKAVSK